MRLDYQRAPGVTNACPDEETFRQMVGVFAKGDDPFSPDAADVVRVILDQRGASYHATIVVLGPDGAQRGNAEEHTFRTCPEGAREAASTAYLIVAPFTFPTPAQTASSASIPSPPAAAPPPEAPPLAVPPPAPPSARRVLVQLGAGAGLVVGLSPKPSAGFTALVGVRMAGSPSWSVSVEGRADIDTTGDRIPLTEGVIAQPRAGFAGGTLAPCVHASLFFGCALASLGHVRTAAGDVMRPRDGEALYFGVGGRAGLEIPLLARETPDRAAASAPPHAKPAFPAPPLLAVQLAADGLLTVVRPGVRVDDTALWQAPIGAGLFGARLLTIF